MLGGEEPEAELRLSVPLERAGHGGQIAAQVGLDGGRTALEDRDFLDHVEGQRRRAKAVDRERSVEDAIAAADEQPVIALGQKQADLAIRRGARLVDMAGNRDLGLAGGPIAPNDFEIDRARRRMSIEIHADRAAVAHAQDLLLPDPAEHFVGLGVDQQPVDDEVVTPRKETLEVRLSRHHVVFLARRGTALTDLILGRGIGKRAASVSHAHTEEAPQLVGVRDRDGHVAALTQQDEERDQHERCTGGVEREAHPFFRDEALGKGQQLGLPRRGKALDGGDHARVEALPTGLRRGRGPGHLLTARAREGFDIDAGREREAGVDERDGLRRVRREGVDDGEGLDQAALPREESGEVEAEADLIGGAPGRVETTQECALRGEGVACPGKVRREAVPDVDEHDLAGVDHTGIGGGRGFGLTRRFEQLRRVEGRAAENGRAVRAGRVPGPAQASVPGDELRFESIDFCDAPVGIDGDRDVAPRPDRAGLGRSELPEARR